MIALQSDWRVKLEPYLPQAIRRGLARVPETVAQRVTEVRVRQGAPVQLRMPAQYGYLSEDGFTAAPDGKTILTDGALCQEMIERMSRYSLYALDDALRQGFIPLPGGFRVGLAGRAVVEAGRISRLVDMSSFNIRIPRQIEGASSALIPHVLRGGRIYSTLILSPPGCGKTTLLRDAAAQLSRRGMQVCIVDERSELAAQYKGRPSFDLGFSCDVLDGYPKAQGMMMAIRTLSPDVIVTDELGAMEDIAAVRDAARCGIGVLASVHAGSVEELIHREALSDMLDGGAFSCLAVLGKGSQLGQIVTIQVCSADGRWLKCGVKEEIV